MKKIIVYAILVVGFFTILKTDCLLAGELSSKLGKIANKFEKTCKENSTDFTQATIAVFPFQCDSKLKKKRIDVAAAQILTTKLIETGSFKIVERTQLNKLLEEQRLGLTGAIETNSAVKVGEMLGSKLLVMGSIVRLGSSYQISARLINTESGEVMDSSFQEVNVKTFEEEAKVYIPLVPDVYAIGLYGSLVSGMNISFMDLPSHTIAGKALDTRYSIDLNPVPLDDASLVSYGIGIRYYPFKKYMLDLGIFLGGLSVGESSDSNDIEDIMLGTNDKETIAKINSDALLITMSESLGFRSSITRACKLSDKLRCYLGFGADVHLIKYEISGNTGQRFDDLFIDVSNFKTSYNSDIIAAEGNTLPVSFNNNLIFGFIRSGIEWKIQPRIGLALFGNYHLKSLTYGNYVEVNFIGHEAESGYTPNPAVVTNKYRIVEIEIPAYSMELTFSFYF